MALVNPNIAMSFRQPEFTPRNALAEYAQIQQIQGGQRQAEVADMQLRRMRQEDEDIERIHQIAMKNGGPDSRMEMGRALFASRNKDQRELGYKILQHEEAKTAFKAAEAQFGYAPGAAAPVMPSSAPSAMAAPAELAAGAQPEPMAPVPGVISTSRVPGVVTAPITPPAGVMRGIAPGGGMGAEMPLAPVNTLAPPAAAPVNAMLASAAPLAPAAAAPKALTGLGGKTLAQLQNEYRVFSRLETEGAPGAKGRVEEIKREMDFIYENSKFGPEQKLLGALGLPVTEANLIKLEQIKQNPGEFERLLSQSGLPKDDQTALIRQRLRKDVTHPPGVDVKVNAYVPASEKAQSEYMAESRATFNTLKNAQPTLDNIEKAKKLIPGALGFMGPGGQPLLTAASFLNSRLGTSIDTKGVTDTTELRSRLFFGILDNLKKLDSQPTAKQQEVLQEALGGIGTDPAALPRVLDAFGESIRTKVNLYNQDVTEAEARGVRFPYRPQIRLTPPPPVPGAGAAQIPTGVTPARAAPAAPTAAPPLPQGFTLDKK
jgi:hypothetical protein